MNVLVLSSVCISFKNSSQPLVSREASKTSSSMSRFVLALFFILAMARQVNNNARSIRIFSPSLNDSYVKSSRWRDRIFSSNDSFKSNLTKKSIAAKYLLTRLLMTGMYCLIILDLIPESRNITVAISSNSFCFSPSIFLIFVALSLRDKSSTIFESGFVCGLERSPI